MIPNILAIAGSDPSGGAGIQADVKAISACGGYAMAAVTALTAQNTRGVTAVRMVEPEMVAAQIAAIRADIRIDAVKIGMLGEAVIVAAAVESLRGLDAPVVLDPVMVAKSGDRLLREEAVGMLNRELLPLALVVTPNLPEAEVLSGRSGNTEDAMRDMAKAVWDLGPNWVLIKGGHRAEDSDVARDFLYDGNTFQTFSGPRFDTPHTHGTGCSLSAAIAAGLATGLEVPEAVLHARRFLTVAIRESYGIGHGHGPVNHFFAQGPGYQEDLEQLLEGAGVTVE